MAAKSFPPAALGATRFLFSDVFRCKYPDRLPGRAFDVRQDTPGSCRRKRLSCRRKVLQVTDVAFDRDGVTIQLDENQVRARYLIDCSGRNSLIGSRFKLRQNYPHLRKFSLFAHFEDVDREPGIDGTLTKMVRCKDRWIWMIPITAKKTSVGVVLDAETFKRLKLEPENAYTQILQENPQVIGQMLRARRVTESPRRRRFFFPEQAVHG